jgi:crotonobetainyl-CoA:carnitine CoA-transferase CaiB-like acyl-CoA transferase
MHEPLAGVRVLAVSQYGAGPYATQILRDLGAEVIKVESPRERGDIGRRVPALFAENNSSLFFEAHNRGKRSVALDLARPEGREAFRRLAAHVDVVFHNLRGDVARRLGLTYADLRDVNPRLVCTALTGYGLEGPDSELPGFDYLFQGKAGWMSLTGTPDSYPVKSGLSLVDFSAAMMAALGTVAGVVRARATGEGGDVDVSLYDTALSLLGYVGTWNMSRGWQPKRLAHSAHPDVVPFQEFPTADGHIVVACVKDKFFVALCEVLGVPELAAQYPTAKDRSHHRETVLAALEARFRTNTTAYWVERLRGRVPCEPVNTVDQALAGGAVPRERGLLAEYQHPVLGLVRTLKTPIKGTGIRPPVERAPFYGEHTAEILRELAGYSGDELEKLKQVGAVPAEAD